MFAPSARHFAPVALTLFALGLTACGTTGGGTTQRIAVVEEDTQGTSRVNIASLTEVIDRNPGDPSAYNTRGAAYARGIDSWVGADGSVAVVATLSGYGEVLLRSRPSDRIFKDGFN